MENNIVGISIEDLKPLAIKYEGNDSYESLQNIAIKISVARAARLSYMTFEGKINYEKDIILHDQLLAAKHASPFEHCCRVLTEEEYNTLGKMVLNPKNGYVFENGWCDNFKGFISYRHLIENS